MGELVSYIDHLQRLNADDLAFYPLGTLEAAIEQRQVITCTDNGDCAGYLWFGSVRGGRDVTIYQACVDYSARRRELGWGMVRDLIALAQVGGATGIRLKCASSAEANEFWQKIGFYCTRVSTGGIKRGRDINHYRTDLTAALITVPTVAPSGRAIDMTDYQKRKRAGEEMPSRFSRQHYGGLN